MAEINNNLKPTKKYKFGSSEIDLGHYIRNLDSNVLSYLDSKSWNDGQKDEFVKAYLTYISGLLELLNSNTDRFSTTSTGGIVDNSGILGNIDDDDIDPVGSLYYYDNKGNRITTDDYNTLKSRKQKKYNTFSANRAVATYFNIVGNAVKNRLPKPESKPETKPEAEPEIKDKSEVQLITELQTAVEAAKLYIAELELKQKDLEIIDKAALLKMNEELDLWAKDNLFESKYSGNLVGGSFDPVQLQSYLDNTYSTLSGEDRLKTYLGLDKIFNDIVNPIIEADTLERGQPVVSKESYDKYYTNIADRLKAAIGVGELQSYNTNEYIIPGSEDYNNYSLVVYNPETGKYKQLSVLLNLRLREALASDWYKRNSENSESPSFLQEGGYLKLKQLAEEQISKKSKESKKNIPIKEEQKETDDRTPEQRKEGERVISEHDWTPAEYARIISAGMDVTSILAALVPGYGTAASAGLGLASTVANFLTDVSDDSMNGWDVAKNLGLRLTADLAGLIPGVGALGKAGKIAKTLKVILPSALAIWGASLNGRDIEESVNKLINGKDLTVDDWKSLSIGLQMLVGGARAYQGNKSVNKQLKSTKDTVPYKTITAESGKTYKVTPEQYEQITSATTLDAQNKAFKGAIGDLSEQLGSKFKTSRWERVRHPFTSEPKTGGGVYYIDKTVDLSTVERIPWLFKINNGQLTPRRWSNEWLLQTTNKWKFKNPMTNWGTVKNPLYNKPAASLVKPPVRPLTDFSIDKTYGRDFEIRDTRNSRERSLGIEFDKLGGILKCEGGDALVPTNGNGVGKKDTYTFTTTNRLQSVLNKIKEGKLTVDNANMFLRKHHSMYSQWKGQPIAGEAVKIYQTNYNDLGWNDEIISPGFANNYNIQSNNPTSGDKPMTWNIDGIYDLITDDRRVMARESDYKDQASIDADIKLAADAGYKYYLDPETKYYMLEGPIKTNLGLEESQPKLKITEPKLKIAEPTNDSNILDNEQYTISRLFNNPTILYGLPRTIHADITNRRITNKAIEAEKPYLKDPLEIHRTISSDLDAEILGKRNYAQLRTLANRPISSDANLLTATLLLAEVQGQDAIIAGKEKSNQRLRLMSELAWQLEKENAANRHDTAMFNRALMWQTAKNKAALENAYLSKKYTIWDTFGLLLEYDAKLKLERNRQLADRFAASDIHNAVSADPNKFGANLSETELALWNRVQAGEMPSTIIQEDSKNSTILASIKNKISQAEQAQLSRYYGISPTDWSRARRGYSTVVVNKKGGKIGDLVTIAGIKARTKDADRFQKQIKEFIDRNEKSIDRLSKSMNGILKSSIFK